MMRKWPTRARIVPRRLGQRARNPNDRERAFLTLVTQQAADGVLLPLSI